MKIMNKKFQAYFNSENDAEASKNKLVKHNAENVEISAMENESLKGVKAYAPYFATTGGHSAGKGTHQAGGFVADETLIPGAKDKKTTNELPKNLEFMLSGDAPEMELDAIIEMLQQNNAYVEVFE